MPAGIGAKATLGPGLKAAPAGIEQGRTLRFIPFGEGARHCVGKNLAQINYTATLATLLGHFSFTLGAQVGRSMHLACRCRFWLHCFHSR